jgi:hypothetical protein
MAESGAAEPGAALSEQLPFVPILVSLLARLRAHEGTEVSPLDASNNTSGAGGFASRTLASPNKAASAGPPPQDNILCGLLQVLTDLLTKLARLRTPVGQMDMELFSSAHTHEEQVAAVEAAARKAEPMSSPGADAHEPLEDVEVKPEDEKKGLVWELFFRFLFTLPLPDFSGAAGQDANSIAELVLPPPPRCQSKESRALGFALLGTSCEGSRANFLQLYRFLRTQQASIQARLRAAAAAEKSANSASGTSTSAWVSIVGEYRPDSVSIAPSGYVGLRNLGSTCYMNSLLQQFFMVPAFRFGILQANPTKLAALQAEGPSPALNDHLLYQLQNLFGHLASSHKQYADTQAFVKSYKDEFGQPVNPRQQQDTQEVSRTNIQLDNQLRLAFRFRFSLVLCCLLSVFFALVFQRVARSSGVFAQDRSSLRPPDRASVRGISNQPDDLPRTVRQRA